MKTKHFIETLQDKNYCVEVVDNKGVYVSLSDGSTLAFIGSACMGELIIRANISLIEDMEERAWLVEHIACFAKTPIDERSAKKYYLKHRWFKKTPVYLQHDEMTDDYFSCENIKDTVRHWNNEFTVEQINKIKERFDTDLKDYAMIEVEE